MIDVIKKEKGKIVIYTKKKASEYIHDFYQEQKPFEEIDEFLLSTLREEATAMGKANLFSLMVDYYNYPIIPIWDL